MSPGSIGAYRSRTDPNLAAACAAQWGALLPASSAGRSRESGLEIQAMTGLAA
jgi:hypothetical protein